MTETPSLEVMLLQLAEALPELREECECGDHPNCERCWPQDKHVHDCSDCVGRGWTPTTDALRVAEAMAGKDSHVTIHGRRNRDGTKSWHVDMMKLLAPADQDGHATCPDLRTAIITAAWKAVCGKEG